MKHCYKCQTFKSLDLFGKNKSRKDGLSDECKECKRTQDRKYAALHREEAKARASKWYYNNYEYARFKQNEYQRKWLQNNLDKHAAKQNKRRASKLKATPKWLTDSHLIQMQCKYSLSAMLSRESGQLHHVDHIIPLKGKTVCGLHVPWNLRVIPAIENMQKHNKI